MKETIALIILLVTVSAVVIIQTLKTGLPPVWFESSLLPLVVAALLSIKFGVEKTLQVTIKKEKDEDEAGK